MMRCPFLFVIVSICGVSSANNFMVLVRFRDFGSECRRESSKVEYLGHNIIVEQRPSFSY